MKKLSALKITAIAALLVFTGTLILSLPLELHGKSVRNNPEYYFYAGDANIMNDKAAFYISHSAVAHSLLVLKSDVPGNALPLTGSVIYIPISRKTPKGFMGKVISIKRDSLVYVTTEYKPVGASIADSEGVLDEYMRHFESGIRAN